LNKLFKAQVGNIDAQARLERAREDAERRTQAPVVIGPEDTPNYTRIMQEAGQAESLAALAKRLGYAIPDPDDVNDYLDSIKAREATLTGDEIDIEFTSVYTLQYTVVGVDLKFNESVFECGTFENGRRVVCPADVQDMPPGGVITLGMIMVGEIPPDNPDRHYIYAAVFDSDADPANNWQFVPPFDWDLFQGTDRWYQLIWNAARGVWSIEVTQLDAGGRGTPAPSSVRVVIEGDTIVFFISAVEFAAAKPGYRLTAFGHDGFFSPDQRGADVSGADPTEPLMLVPAEAIEVPD
jgi:hypothetical protein